ncbi:M55 family metallopeptidase [Brevibacillus fluminis]|uniref:M55 family metallopeptidase n=1 Tax=Brevibacillus fluminis TaxID=511487 RepID=UPI003F8A9FF6
MKLFISIDMEGISGIVDVTYCDPDRGINYDRGRRFMTADANAAIEGALEAGVTDILVADSHDNMRNVLIENLHPQAKLLSGTSRDYSMMHGLDSSYDAAIFLGYHSRHGAPGVLSHTMSGVIKNMYVNGQVVGEFGFNAIYAGLLGVPVVMVSGDDHIAEEAKSLIPGISTAIVKTAASRTAAICLPLSAAQAEIKAKTIEALARVKEIQPLTTETPLELKIEFSHAGQAEMAALVPGSEYKLGTTEVSVVCQDQHDMYKVMRAMLNLAGVAKFW